MSTHQSILVLGAGELGMAVLTSLARDHRRRGASITVLLRPSKNTAQTEARTAQLASLDIHTLPGDIVTASDSALAEFFRPYDTVVGCVGMVGPPGLQMRLARAAIAAGVPRYLPWQFGMDYEVIGRDSSQDLFSEQLDVRDLLRGQEAVEWVIISTGLFLSFLFWGEFGVVSEARDVVRALGAWENRITVTRVEDIGQMTAEVVFGADTGSRVVHIAGDTITYARLADVVEKVYGRKVDRRLWTVDHLTDDLKTDPENGTKKYRVVFAEGKGVAWDIESTLNAKMGIKLQTIEQWLRADERKIVP
jgi:hypothetical protein